MRLLTINSHEAWIHQLGELEAEIDIVDRFVARTPGELGDYARSLLSDRELAGRLGAAARRKVAERFSSRRFILGLERAIATAREHWRALNCRN